MTGCNDFTRRFLWLAIVVLPVTARQARGAEQFMPQLTAFELSSDQVHAGGTLVGSYEFTNIGKAPPSAECTVFVHIRPALPGDPDVKPAAGADFRPATPTFVWLPRTIVRQRGQQIKIPKDFPPGRYSLLLGLWDQDSGKRYKLANDELATSGGRCRLAVFDVLPREKPLAGKPISTRWHATAGLADAEVEVARQPVGDAIRLDSGRLRVSLSATRPVVLAYELPDGRRLSGDLSGYPVRARVHSTHDGKSRLVCLSAPRGFSLRRQDTEARYSVKVLSQEVLAASFDLVFRLDGNVLRVGVENVKEESGYLLMDVCLPQLVATRGPAGQLVLPTQGGRLIHLDRSAPGRHVIGMNWFEMDLCGAVVGEGCAAAICSRDWDNELDARVAGAEGNLTGGCAVRLALRADAHGKAAKIRLAQNPSVQVAVLETTKGGPATWVDAAKWLRSGVNGSPKTVYKSTLR